MIGRGGRDDDQIDLGGVHAGVSERSLCRLQGQHRGRLVIGRDMALADAGALHDPLIGRVDALCQLGVGDDALRQIGAAAAQNGAQNGQESCSLFGGGSLLRHRLRPRCRGHHLADLRHQVLASHFIAQFGRAGEADGVGAAMALDDDALEPQEDAAIDLARIHLVPQRCKALRAKR